jgi:hypothetical protein
MAANGRGDGSNELKIDQCGRFGQKVAHLRSLKGLVVQCLPAGEAGIV